MHNDIHMYSHFKLINLLWFGKVIIKVQMVMIFMVKCIKPSNLQQSLILLSLGAKIKQFTSAKLISRIILMILIKINYPKFKLHLLLIMES